MLNRSPHLPVYAQLPLTLTAGRGAEVLDQDGNSYLDMYGGHAVAVAGHCHPRVVEALVAQAGRLMFYSNAVDIPVRRELCERLLTLGPENLRSVFLCNSGAEANENALTLARLATGRRKVVSLTGGFHGRTLLTLSLSGLARYRSLAAVAGEPLVADVEIVPFGDLPAAEQVIDQSCAAVIIEPVQGLGGCLPAPADYLRGLRRLCDRCGALLIFDEVQCGSGRCGAFTVAQLRNVAPNLLTLAKGLGGGFPIGAVLIDESTARVVRPGDLGTTFGGGPLACAAALANLQAMFDEGMIDNAARLGAWLNTRSAGIPGVLKVQGEGLMLGLVLDRPAAGVRDKLLREHRILTGTSAAPGVLRLLPPLNLTMEQAKRFCSALQDVLTKEQP